MPVRRQKKDRELHSGRAGPTAMLPQPLSWEVGRNPGCHKPTEAPKNLQVGGMVIPKASTMNGCCQASAGVCQAQTRGKAAEVRAPGDIMLCSRATVLPATIDSQRHALFEARELAGSSRAARLRAVWRVWSWRVFFARAGPSTPLSSSAGRAVKPLRPARNVLACRSKSPESLSAWT